MWKQYLGHEHEYKFTDYLVADVIKCNGYMPCSCKDLEFIYFHVTTSANICTSFRKHGILDLKQSYLCNDSELRIFLENHDIHINLDDRILIYGEQEFDITFGDCPSRNTEAYNCWSIGRKFYFDYTICGFLSVTERSAYGGQVHRRPEILKDIDKLFGLNLSREWMSTHDSYEVVAKVSGEKVIYDSDENQSDEDKILYYLTKAYLTAFSEPSENILMLKNNIQIPPRDIVKIKPMKYWKDC
ncbi:hypothetical protein Z957_06915 [Clostridium sp. K25]|uniref:hypothetical protein n=1 Tax=Clostridium sp. K25 TaxID=1443109 RepID=UPI0004DAAAD2|nr:hypothetical protein [Clostridium sp. K25]KEI08613.1 hypothetical protein Z957_06915 [Clostridium sp. K25]